MVLVSIDPPAPKVTIATDASSLVMNMMITDRLYTDLKAERSRYQVVVPAWPSADQQNPLAVFSAKSEPGLDHRRKGQNTHSFVREFACTADLLNEAMKRGIRVGINLSC
jgi:hypothetical protein